MKRTEKRWLLVPQPFEGKGPLDTVARAECVLSAPGQSKRDFAMGWRQDGDTILRVTLTYEVSDA